MGPIRRRVRLRTMQKRCPDPCDAITLVRKRTLRHAVESTILNLAELQCLAQVSAVRVRGFIFAVNRKSVAAWLPVLKRLEGRIVPWRN